VREQEFGVFFFVYRSLWQETEDLFPGLSGFFRVGFFKFYSKVAQKQRLTGFELLKSALQRLHGFFLLPSSQVEESYFAQLRNFLKTWNARDVFLRRVFLRGGGQKAGSQAFEDFSAFFFFELQQAFALEVQRGAAK